MFGVRHGHLARARLSHRWTTFTALSLLGFLVSAGTFNSLGVVLPAMVRELGWSWTQAGLGFTLLGLSCGLMSIPTAQLVRRIGVRSTLLAGSLLLMAGFGALAIVHAVWLYWAATLVLGVAFALTASLPGTYVLIRTFRRRSTVLGAYFTSGALGAAAGPLFYIAIDGPAHGWRPYWWVFAAGAAVLGAFAVASIPAWLASDPDKNDPAEPLGPAQVIERLNDWTVRHALATPQFYVLTGAYTIFVLINTVAHGFAVEHLIERGISTDVAAATMSLEAVIGAGFSLIGGLAGEKVKPKTLLVVSLAALVGGMVALAEARGYPLMLTYAVGVGMAYGLITISTAMLTLNYFGKRASMELYAISGMLSTSAALGPAIGGWVRDTLGSFTGVFLFCAFITFIMLIATLFLQPPRERAPRAAPKLSAAKPGPGGRDEVRGAARRIHSRPT